MADVFSRSKRSEVMAAIRSSGNRSTELKLIAIFRAHKIKGWRRHQSLPGRPDFVFRKSRLVVFVDGCFWHGCRWHCRMPKVRLGFWKPKIDQNMIRDRKVAKLLRTQGWSVWRIWEHSLAQPDDIIAKLQTRLASAAKRNLIRAK